MRPVRILLVVLALIALGLAGWALVARDDYGQPAAGPAATEATPKATTAAATPATTPATNAALRPRIVGFGSEPVYPQKGFTDLTAARQWASCFVHWYNHEHRNSGIRYVTPAQRHAGHDRALLAERHAIYQRARERNPQRWSGQTRNWTPITVVTLNPERDSFVPSLT